MKRVVIFLAGVLAAVVLAPVGLSVSGGLSAPVAVHKAYADPVQRSAKYEVDCYVAWNNVSWNGTDPGGLKKKYNDANCDTKDYANCNIITAGAVTSISCELTVRMATYVCNQGSGAAALCNNIDSKWLVSCGGKLADADRFTTCLEVQKNVAAAGGDITGGGGPVCIALPIVPGDQGACKTGEVQIGNNADSGGAIVAYLKLVLRLVNDLIGVIIVLVLVIAGIQYMISRGDPAEVKGAKKRIENAITALVLYLLSVAIPNFLIPGGIL